MVYKVDRLTRSLGDFAKLVELFDAMECRSQSEKFKPANYLDPGWGARIRTWEWRNQNPLPYHLATPHRVGAGATI